MLSTRCKLRIESLSKQINISQLISRRHSSSTSSVLTSLSNRGLVKSVTSPKLDVTASQKAISLYCGVDPTAPSLHVGNLLALIPVLHYYLNGHKAVALVGGATGRVGDPAGKISEREKLATDAISKNVSALTLQLSRFFQNGSNYAQVRGYGAESMGTFEIVNNADWYSNLNFMDFMNDVGRNVRLSSMLARDSVKNRLAGDGMSFGEFSYQLLQAYDFWQLYKTRGVSLQIGGSDQYGNITAGIDLISRLQQQPEDKSNANIQEVFGLTVPLLTTPSGEKFGKSAGNAIWLDPLMTSPFDLYQYFLRTPDSHLDSYLRLFTLLSIPKIEGLVADHKMAPGKRKANRVLAGDVVMLVHGSKALESVDVANRILFPHDFEDQDSSDVLSATDILEAFKDNSSLHKLIRAKVVGVPVHVLMRLYSGIKSGKEAQRLIAGGAVSIGDHKITSEKEVVHQELLIDDKVLLLRIGKNKVLVIEVLDGTQ